MRLLVIGIRLVQFILFEMQIPHQDRITRLHRILLSQLFQFPKRLVGLFQLGVEPIFLHREGLIHADGGLQRIQRLNRLLQLPLLGECIG